MVCIFATLPGFLVNRKQPDDDFVFYCCLFLRCQPTFQQTATHWRKRLSITSSSVTAFGYNCDTIPRFRIVIDPSIRLQYVESYMLYSIVLCFGQVVQNGSDAITPSFKSSIPNPLKKLFENVWSNFECVIFYNPIF
jgi:hypothetical protein